MGLKPFIRIMFSSTLSNCMILYFPRSSFLHEFSTRSDGSRQAILSDAFRVNANLFQTNLCQKT